MTTRWLWGAWAVLTLVALIAMEGAVLAFSGLYIIPKVQRLFYTGIIDGAELERYGYAWMPNFLEGVRSVGEDYSTLLLVGAGAAAILFEWRVRGENKPFIRLSVLGTVALGLTVLVILEATSLVIPLTTAMPRMGRMVRPFAVEQIAAVDSTLNALESGLAKKDWASMRGHAERASKALTRLSTGPAVHSLLEIQSATFAELREHVSSTKESLREAEEAIRAEDANRLETALQKMRTSFAPLREAGRMPQP